MKFLVTILVALIALPAFSSQKIGFFDMEKAVEMTKSGKKAVGKLKKIQGKKQAELDKRKKEIEAKRKSLMAKLKVLSQEAQAQKKQEFQRELIQAEQYYRESQVELARKQEELLNPVVKGLRGAAQKYGNKEGYTMILERTGNLILFAKADTDLTSKIVKAYGK